MAWQVTQHRYALCGRHKLTIQMGLFLIGSFVYYNTFTPVAKSKEAENILISAMAEGYLHNKAKLGNFRCSYRVNWGLADSFDAALEGNFRRVRAVDCKWIRSGEVERNSMAGTEKWMKEFTAKEATSDGKLGSPFFNFTEIRNNGQSIYFNENALRAVFFSSRSGKSRVGHSLFSYGILGINEEKSFAEFAKRGTKCQIEAESQEMVSISIPDNSLTYRFNIDTRKGFIPTTIEIRIGASAKLRMISKVIDIRKVGNDAYIPWKITTVSGTQGKYYVLEFVGTDFQADYNATDEDFLIHVPSGTNLQSDDDKDLRGRVPTDLTVGLSDFDRLDSICQELKAIHEMQGGKSTEKTGTQNSILLVGITAVLLLVIGALIFIKKREVNKKK